MLIQNLVVTLVALGAVAFIVRRVTGLGRRGTSETACPSCTTGAGACATPAKTTPPDVHPLTLVRSKTR